MAIITIFTFLLLLILLGFPVVFGIALSAVITLILFEDVPMSLISTVMFSSINSYSLVAVPLFILAGELLNAGTLTEKIIKFSRALVGNIRGGLAHVNVLASMLFGGVSGSTTADTAAVGSVMIPAMEKAGYHKDFSISLTVTSSTIGAIIPPSILMIIYGALTEQSIGRLFLGGIIPGIIMGLALMICSYFICVARGYKEKEPFSLRKVLSTGKQAIWATLVPLVIVVGISTGSVTPTESGILAVFTAFILGAFVYRQINSFAMIRKILVRTALTSTVVLLILSFSAVFTEVLFRQRFQAYFLSFINSFTTEPILIMLIMIVFVFIFGMFVDTMVILMMFSLPFLEIAVANGFDPIHFGVIMVLSSLVSAVTPPVGVLLFLGCSIGKTSVTNVIRIHSIFVLTLITVIIFIILVPGVVTYLPNMLME